MPPKFPLVFNGSNGSKLFAGAQWLQWAGRTQALTGSQTTRPPLKPHFVCTPHGKHSESEVSLTIISHLALHAELVEGEKRCSNEESDRRVIT